MSAAELQIAWDRLEGGYRTPYDPRPAFAAIATGAGDWEELWQELHHQGDVGVASYAAVTLIADHVEHAAAADWNPFMLAAVIEIERHNGRNPPMPDWLDATYAKAWRRLAAVAHGRLPDAREEGLIRGLFAVLAIGKAQPLLARMAMISEAERRDMLDEAGCA